MFNVCLISSSHLSYNPRLLKEADALVLAGYTVRVIVLNTDMEKAALDRNLMQERKWSLTFIDAQPGGEGRWRWFYDSLRQCFYQTFPLCLIKPEYAYSRHVRMLFKKAVEYPADLYIAHNLQALPAAVKAARRRNVRVGFDAEDFHRGELPDDGSKARRLTEKIEERYVSRCDYVTAASDGIANAYAQCLSIKRPTTILNVFPVSEECGHTPERELGQEKPTQMISLYWYSQTIGRDRGLQDALYALALLDERIVLSLRGTWAAGFEEGFMELANQLGVAGRVRHLPPAPPAQLVERAAQHDVGLALEQAHTRNRDICVTNKLFTYLLAGIPFVATDTQGQREICQDFSDAGRLCPTGDTAALAHAIGSLLESEESLQEAKTAASRAGKDRYNWDVEKETFLSVISAQLNKKAEKGHPISCGPAES